MKNVKLSAVPSLTAVLILFCTTLFIVSVNAQEVPQDLADAAEEACVRSAESKGFTLEQVVSIEPKGTDGASAVLNLSRNGQAYQLNCDYSKKDGAVFSEDITEATTVTSTTTPTTTLAATTAPDLAPLWWLLLPLMALPLLLWWTSRRDASEATADRTATAVTGDDYDAIVRTNGSLINVHSGPNDTHKIIGTLRNNQRVSLSGSHDRNWAELINGGWVNTQYLE